MQAAIVLNASTPIKYGQEFKLGQLSCPACGFSVLNNYFKGKFYSSIQKAKNEFPFEKTESDKKEYLIALLDINEFDILQRLNYGNSYSSIIATVIDFHIHKM